MKKNIHFLIGIFVIFLFSCNPSEDSKSNAKSDSTPKEGYTETVINESQQKELTPQLVIQRFKEGNANFVNNDLTKRNHSKQIRSAVAGQYPKAIVLSCVDSRVPVEDVFDKGIGDLFVARVAGNFVNEDILGSMEFACKVSGSKLILVLGHENCGAIKAAVDDVKLGNISAMLEKIKPSVESVKYEGERNSKNTEFVHMVSESNVKNTIEQIRMKSPILKEMETNGEIKIVGAIYDMNNGKVQWLE